MIRAMLVAPLVGPLLGTGLALVQGNVHLMRVSLHVALGGVLLGLAVAVFFGVINPGFEPTLEIEARGRPDLLQELADEETIVRVFIMQEAPVLVEP